MTVMCLLILLMIVMFADTVDDSYVFADTIDDNCLLTLLMTVICVNYITIAV